MAILHCFRKRVMTQNCFPPLIMATSTDSALNNLTDLQYTVQQRKTFLLLCAFLFITFHDRSLKKIIPTHGHRCISIENL